MLCYSKKYLKIQQHRIYIPAIAFLLISIVSLLRFDVGWDYIYYYQAVATNDIYLIRRFEPFSSLFFYLAIGLNSPHFIFLLFGIPTYYFVYKVIKYYSVNIGFSIVLYFCFFYLESLGFIRQALAVSICFYSLKFVFERRFFPFFIWTIVAVLFHYSAIITLVTYFLYKRVKLNFLIYVLPLLFIIREIVFRLLASIGIYTSYLEQLYTMEGGALIRYFYVLLFLSLLVFKRKRILSDNDEYFFFTIGLALTFPFLLGSHIGVRLSSYFFIYYIILIPNIITEIQIKFAYVFVAFLFLFMILMLTTRDPIKSQYVPYQFIFEIDKPVFRDFK